MDPKHSLTNTDTRRLVRNRLPARIEPVIGHLKEDGHLERNHLAGAEGDAINAILCAARHNMRLLAAWIRLLFALPVAIIHDRPAQNPVDHQLAIAA